MSGILSYVLGTGKKSGVVNLKSVEIHDIENSVEKPARSLKHLIKANHITFSIFYHNNLYHNHICHGLTSSYLLGANEEQLRTIYETETKELEEWVPAPAEVMDEDWRDFLGDKTYQRAFLDYFEDNLALEFAYDWKQVVTHFLFSGENPLFHSLASGIGHSLIHLAYAYEMDSKEIAMEALAMTCCSYNFTHKYLDDGQYTRSSPLSQTSPMDLLSQLSQDSRFDDTATGSRTSNLEDVIVGHEDAVLEYWNALDFDDATKQFQLLQQAAVSLLVATNTPDTPPVYNFYIAHILTSGHAVRVLLPLIPAEHHVTLLRQWWLLMLSTYILKNRPLIQPASVETELKGRQWSFVEHKALTSKWACDAHYVKVIRAIREASRTWDDRDNQYLLSAITFADKFDGWTR